MPDLPDWSQSVSIDAASVTIPISGSITITSGSVTIANASIAVINATGTKITSARPPRRVIFVADSPNPNTANYVLDADVQALVIELPEPLAQYVHVKVAWHPVTGGALGWVPLELYEFTQNVYVVPITPDTFDTQGNVTNSIDVTIQGTSLNGQSVVGHYLFESAPIWLELFPLPQLEPNQVPFGFVNLFAASGAAWIISPVANVEIVLFELILERLFTSAAAGSTMDIGTGTSLPGAAPGSFLIEVTTKNGTDTPHTANFSGAPLGRGNGLWVWATVAGGNTANISVTPIYSLR